MEYLSSQLVYVRRWVAGTKDVWKGLPTELYFDEGVGRVGRLSDKPLEVSRKDPMPHELRGSFGGVRKTRENQPNLRKDLSLNSELRPEIAHSATSVSIL